MGRPQPIIFDHVIHSHGPRIPRPFTFTGTRHHDETFTREHSPTLANVRRPAEHLFCAEKSHDLSKGQGHGLFFARNHLLSRARYGPGRVLALKDCWVDGNSLEDEIMLLTLVEDVPNVIHLVKYWDAQHDSRILDVH